MAATSNFKLIKSMSLKQHNGEGQALTLNSIWGDLCHAHNQLRSASAATDILVLSRRCLVLVHCYRILEVQTREILSMTQQLGDLSLSMQC